jgi:hypothetical protein
MEWNNTIAATCRYGDIAGKIWGDWEILWEDSESYYQGHASFVAKKGNKYCFYEWWYGSCSGCDSWESAGLSDEAIEKEMMDTALWMNGKKQILKWLDMLTGNPISNHGDGGICGKLDILSGGIRDRINAIRAYFDMPPLKEALDAKR